MWLARVVWACAGATALIAPWGCGSPEQAKPVNLLDVERTPTPAPGNAHAGPTLRVALASMISPSHTRLLYKDLVDYIGERSKSKVVLKQRRTYGEVNELFARGELDLALLCSAPYVEAHDKFGARVLVVPVVRGERVYRSYLIVRAGSGIRSLQELRGKRFAFVDPLSNTGFLWPTYLLARGGESPDSFFASYSYTASHDNSIQAVAEGFADGAAVDSLVYDFLRAEDSDLVRRTQVIQQSQPFGMPPFVIPADASPGLAARLKSLLLSMHREPRGREILHHLGIERFAEGDDGAYDSIRSMQTFLRRRAHSASGSGARAQ